MSFEIKVVLAVVASLFVAIFYAVFTQPYEVVHRTGNEVELTNLMSDHVVDIKSEGYQLVAESCYPFTIKLDGETEFPGFPQDISGTNCQGSYYKLEGKFEATKLEVVSGTVVATFVSETPIGVIAGYPEDVRNNAYRNANIIAGLIWFLCMLVLFWFIPN